MYSRCMHMFYMDMDMDMDMVWCVRGFTVFDKARTRLEAGFT